MVDEQNPMIEQMASDFGDEQLSVDVLEGVRSDKGGRIQHEGGTVTVAPSGYGDELRKNRNQRTPIQNFSVRPSSIQLFSWNGVPSQVPIAYGPGGSNPSISRYLRKKHCNTCQHNGFIGRYCGFPQCGSSDVVSYFYPDYESVPVKTNWYGDVPCLCSQDGEMVGECPRDGREVNGRLTGFLSTQQMLMHATSKHMREYGIWQTLRQGGSVMPQQADEVAQLRRELAEFKAALGETPVAPQEG